MEFFPTECMSFRSDASAKVRFPPSGRNRSSGFCMTHTTFESHTCTRTHKLLILYMMNPIHSSFPPPSHSYKARSNVLLFTQCSYCTYEFYIIIVFVLLLKVLLSLNSSILSSGVVYVSIPIEDTFHHDVLGAAWEVHPLTTLTLQVQQLCQEVGLGKALDH